MKKKLSVSIEETTLIKLENCMREGNFRNKSHVVESAIDKLVKEILK